MDSFQMPDRGLSRHEIADIVQRAFEIQADKLEKRILEKAVKAVDEADATGLDARSVRMSCMHLVVTSPSTPKKASEIVEAVDKLAEYVISGKKPAGELVE